jgi:hypothetical protein
LRRRRPKTAGLDPVAIKAVHGKVIRAIGFHLPVGAGFRVDRIATGYMPGPKPMTFMYEGSARPS